jgi:hypothetical protein
MAQRECNRSMRTEKQGDRRRDGFIFGAFCEIDESLVKTMGETIARRTVL